MAMGQKKSSRRWVQVLIAVLVIVAGLLIIKSKYGKHHPVATTPETAHHGETEKMMGINSTPPEKLESFKSVTGVLNIQHWVTARGVNVYFVPVPTLPMVDIEIIFDAGAARNGDKGGLAYLTNTLLAEGTANMTADQVAESFDKVGAQFNAESQRDMALVHLRSLSERAQLGEAVNTLAAILSNPAFPLEGFKREQQNTLSALKQQEQKPQQVASKAFTSALYGKQPYANWVLGDEASIKALTPEDLRAFYQKYYTAKNATVAIVGDLSAEDADALAQKLTNNLPEGEKAQALPPVAGLTEKITKKIDFPSAQTTILVGQPGMIQNDPDYYALAVGNHILGGNGSVTRVFNTIRNQHGLAYSAYSYFLPMREKGPFVMGCQTRNDQADKALAMMQELLKEFVEKGPTEKELEQAKQNLLGGYALQFDSNASICHEIATLGFYNLPLNHFNEFKDAVSKLTVEDIKKAFEKRISPEKVVIVTVGGGDKQVTKPTAEGASEPEPMQRGPGGVQH